MNVWFGKIAVLVSILGFIFIRWPHGNRMGSVPIAEDRKGRQEAGVVVWDARSIERSALSKCAGPRKYYNYFLAALSRCLCSADGIWTIV